MEQNDDSVDLQLIGLRNFSAIKTAEIKGLIASEKSPEHESEYFKTKNLAPPRCELPMILK